MFEASEVKIANKTARGKGNVGLKAITPAYVRYFLNLRNAKEDTMILDFGAGKTAMHARELLEEGFLCTAYEFGDNVDIRYHNELALMQEYDIVYASNVLNVQSSMLMLRTTLGQIHKVLKDDGIFFANYPKEPRKGGFSGNEMMDIISQDFTTITDVNPSSSTRLWQIRK